jgi:hypothetical protein
MYKGILQFYFSVWKNEILGKVFQTLRYINRKLWTRSISKDKNQAPDEDADDNDKDDNKIIIS